MPRIAIVGNAPLRIDHTTRIDTADKVVRFNNTAGLNGPAGRRTDQLWLVNRGGQAAEWLADPAFWRRPIFATLREVVLPLPADAGGSAQTSGDPGARDHSRAIGQRLAGLDIAVRQMPTDLVRRARRVLCGLGSHRSLVAPSTGFLAMLHFADSDMLLDLYGFGFDGWDGHDWAQERAWAHGMVRAGRAVLNPP